MDGILHQLIWRISHHLQGFIPPRWYRISSINSRSICWRVFVSQMIFVAGILCVQQDAYLEFFAIPSGLFFLTPCKGCLVLRASKLFLPEGAWSNLLRAKDRQFCHLCLECIHVSARSLPVDEGAFVLLGFSKPCREARMLCV